MVSHVRVLASCLATTALATTLGCSGGGGDPMPIHGTVRFRDGSVPWGEIAVIRLEPRAPNGRPAFGNIHEDGSFDLSTVNETKGVLPGNYKVTLRVSKTYRPPHVSLVAAKYDRAETSDIEVQISPGGPDSFDFKIDRR